ncbi:MAG: c-type cytochrome domain-containing protein [bacterium]
MKAAAALTLALLAACDDAPAEDCAAGDDAAIACAPLHAPELAEIQARTLTPSCAVAGACHAAEGRAGGLDLSSAAASYEGLVASGRVQPGSPACSELVHRIDGAGALLMPPGAPLSEAARCAIRQWIHAGATP